MYTATDCGSIAACTPLLTATEKQIPANDDDRPLAIGVLGSRVEWMVDQADPNQELGHVSIFIQCPHCGEQHSHGFSPGRDDPTRASHRLSHCSSPYRNDGYVIRPALPGEVGFDQHGTDPFALLVRPNRQWGHVR